MERTEEQKENNQEIIKIQKEQLADVIAMLLTKEEIEKEANSYDNSMASMAEAAWMPQGFKEGVEWTIKKLEDRLKGN